MTTLYDLQTLHRSLKNVIALDVAKITFYPGSFGFSYGARSRLKGKCKREHAFLKTFVPLNRNLGKYLTQASIASQDNFDLSSSRFRDAAFNLSQMLFERYVEGAERAHNEALLQVPLSAALVRTVPALSAKHGRDLLEKLTGNTLGELRESFALLETERRAQEEVQSNVKALALEGLLKRLEGSLSVSEHNLLSGAVRKSYSAGQKVFLRI